MNIKEVAEISRLPAKTIRFYEEIGLVRPGRAPNGYRRFSERDLHKLAFIGRARSLGFTVEDCRTLLSLYEDRGRASAEVKQIAENHLQRIEEKIVELQAMKRTLGELVGSCRGDHRPDCPILEDLAGEPVAGLVDDRGVLGPFARATPHEHTPSPLRHEEVRGGSESGTPPRRAS